MSEFLSFKVAQYPVAEESPARYVSGEFFAIRLGDIYGQHYQVVRKLGYGAFSTVWLAEDLRDGKAVALKVLARDASRHELDIMQQMKASASPAKYTKYVVQLFESFEHSNYLCLVMELMSQDVTRFLEGYRDELKGPHIPVVKKLSRQILEALNFIHESGIVHNDFHPGNFLISRSSGHETIRDIMDAESSRGILYDKDDFEEYDHEDGTKTIIYPSQPVVNFLPGDSFSIDDISVKIADFGKASYIDQDEESRSRLGYGARSVAAPEQLLGGPWDFRTDIWSLGASIFQLLTFDPFVTTCSSTADIVCDLITVCGPPPDHLLGKSLAIKEALQSRSWKQKPFTPYSYSLPLLIFEALPHLSGSMNRTISDFLSSMLQVDPAERCSLAELKSHRWWYDSDLSSPCHYPCLCFGGSQVDKVEKVN